MYELKAQSLGMVCGAARFSEHMTCRHNGENIDVHYAVDNLLPATQDAFKTAAIYSHIAAFGLALVPVNPGFGASVALVGYSLLASSYWYTTDLPVIQRV